MDEPVRTGGDPPVEPVTKKYIERRDRGLSGIAELSRLRWLRGLPEAYMAIASGATLEDRVAEVCVQTRRFLGAADSRLVFGREIERSVTSPAGDEISAHLLGNAGLLTVTAPRDRRWNDDERTALQQLAALISAPIHDARRLEMAQRAGQVGILLGGVAGPNEVLERFLEQGVERSGADRGVVRLVDDERAVGDDSALAALQPVLDDVARTGESVFSNGTGGEHGVWAVLPVGTSTLRFGVVALGFDEPQPFDEVQRSFLADVGRRLTAALDRSRAYESERVARQEAEIASARLRDLQGLASDLARAATRRRVAEVLLRRAMVSAGAPTGTVAMSTTQPEVEVLAAVGPLRAEQWKLIRTALVKVLPSAVDIGSNGRLLVVDTVSLPGLVADELGGAGIEQLAWQPILTGEHEIGVLLLGWPDVVADRDVDRHLLQAQVAMAGSTLQRAARYDVEHAIAGTLQRSMLALPPITTERVRWSVLYRAGSAGLAGGDWYDLIEIDEHRLAIVVGDIVGRGVEAAASMGQLRSATRALATQIDAPAELLAALDRYATNTGQGRYSSLAYVLLDTRTGEIAHAVAGHPPPILRLPDGRASVVNSGRGPLLGLPCERTDAGSAIVPGTSIVMYTDGLVERRGESLDVGIERLVSAVQAAGLLHPDDACRDLVDRLLDVESDAENRPDDVAVVIVELLAQ